MTRKKIFFASDFHLGADARLSSKQRELQVVHWLQTVAPEAEAIFLLGDIFEFWFEYRTVVPKGYTRLLGTLAELRDNGIQIEVFTGNHDLWMSGYFEEELGIPVHLKPIQRQLLGKKFFLGHGDGLGPNDIGYKRMKKVFTNPACKWLFSWLHPDLGSKLAHFTSKKSRAATPPTEKNWLGEEHEWLAQYVTRKVEQGSDADFFVFGHRHLPIDWQIKGCATRYINTGDWLWHNSYVSFDGETLKHSFFEADQRLFTNRF